MPGKGAIYLLEFSTRWFALLHWALPAVLWRLVNKWQLWLVDVVRVGAGSSSASGLDKCARPKQPLELYEFEGCPFCRKVRETLSVLAIDYVSFPCPKESFAPNTPNFNSRYRGDVTKHGGKMMFPFLVDPNTQTKLNDSDDIMSYLWKTYGSEAKPPLCYSIGHSAVWKAVSLSLCVFLRPLPWMGVLRSPARHPEKRLELHGAESNADARQVREALCSCEIAYLNKCITNVPGAAFKLVDPNISRTFTDSDEAAAHILAKYRTLPPPSDSWLAMIAPPANQKKTQ